MENSRQEHEFLQRPRIYRFGDFVLNVERYELRKDGTPIRLQPKTFDVLCYLALQMTKELRRTGYWRLHIMNAD